MDLLHTKEELIKRGFRAEIIDGVLVVDFESTNGIGRSMQITDDESKKLWENFKESPKMRVLGQSLALLGPGYVGLPSILADCIAEVQDPDAGFITHNFPQESWKQSKIRRGVGHNRFKRKGKKQ